MQTKQNKEAESPASSTGYSLDARDRILEASCELFAEAGFHGTHLRGICRRAGTNVAGVCYYFQSKEGLYQAVIMEAGRRLANLDEDFVTATHLSPEQKMQKLVESLLQRLNAGGAWIPRLLAWELVEPGVNAHNYVASGLERDFVLLQAVMKDLAGTDTHSEVIRLHALSLIRECVYFSLAGENLTHPLIQLTVRLPNRERLARFLTKRTLGALRFEASDQDNSEFNL
jgi:AcrR family transcriptional regulator